MIYRSFSVPIAIALSICSGANATNSKFTAAADVFFAFNSAKLPDKAYYLDELACKAKKVSSGLEVIIAVGHGNKNERDVDELARARAIAVKEFLIGHTIAAGRIYTEGKGAKQPTHIGNDSRNRRVEIELVGAPWRGEQFDCRPTWEKLYFDLPINQAIIVANGEIRQGFVNPLRPMDAAILARRFELFEAFVDSIQLAKLSPDDQLKVAESVIRYGEPEYIRHWLTTSGFNFSQLSSVELPLEWAVCGDGSSSNASRSDQRILAAVDSVVALGARADRKFEEGASNWNALNCAVRYGRTALVERLLRLGLDADLPLSHPPLLEAALNHPTVVRQLLLAGATPHAKNNQGENLFHLFKFNAADEVAWVASLGVDINAEASYGRTPLATAARHASVEVLDAFVKHGASAQKVLGLSIAKHNYTDAPSLAWLIDKGAVVENPVTLAQQVARRGVRAIPVFVALRLR